MNAIRFPRTITVACPFCGQAILTPSITLVHFDEMTPESERLDIAINSLDFKKHVQGCAINEWLK